MRRTVTGDTLSSLEGLGPMVVGSAGAARTILESAEPRSNGIE
jgi:hypothetical protein